MLPKSLASFIALEAFGTENQNSNSLLLFKFALVIIPILLCGFKTFPSSLNGFFPSHFPWLLIVFKK